MRQVIEVVGAAVVCSYYALRGTGFLGRWVSAGRGESESRSPWGYAAVVCYATCGCVAVAVLGPESVRRVFFFAAAALLVAQVVGVWIWNHRLKSTERKR